MSKGNNNNLKIKNMTNLSYTVFAPTATKENATCLGEINFLNNKLWKVAVMLGYAFNSNVLTTTGLSFSSRGYNDDDIANAEKFLTANHIEFKKEMSLNHWDVIIKISKSKANLEAIAKAYKSFYRKNK